MSNPSSADLPAFAAPYAEDDAPIARRLLDAADLGAAAEARIDSLARDLIQALRQGGRGLGELDDLFRAFTLSSPEGIALMTLAEALLRVPDDATVDRLIEDKLGQADFAAARGTASPLAAASSWMLGLTARVLSPSDTPEGLLAQVVRRLGRPTVRAAVRQTMRLMGSHFVLGQTIEAALDRAGSRAGRLYRYSFDMLGEGARTSADADRYFAAYGDAIAAIAARAGTAALPDRPGISVKLSALHPRYEATNRDRVLRELGPRLLALAQAARAHDLNFTVDAEEADRLELSLAVIGTVLADPSLAGWTGFGLAIQAYQKRAAAVIDHVAALAARLDRRLMVRLVKGAYWDAEVKRAQERGLDGYPVFTRKAMTDLNYVACARALLAHRPRIFPQFATHNALTVATIVELAGGEAGGSFEFQRLHGMGGALYEHLLRKRPDLACRTYAPVGIHRDLLAYLVRRLLENGANASFVFAGPDPAVPVDDLLVRPRDRIARPERARHPALPLPPDLYGAERRNARGFELGDAATLARLLADIAAHSGPAAAMPIVDGTPRGGAERPVLNPADGTPVGRVAEADAGTADAAVAAAVAGFAAWSRMPAARRAEILEQAADRLEAAAPRLLALLQREAGKTLDDAIAELREAVDFCRYYAVMARRLFAAPVPLPGPTGESNRLGWRGRGAFVAISPWNFPLAIFLGQITAALAAGNTVVAKPAEQTPLIAAEAVRLLHASGVPGSALQLVPGDGAVGARLVRHPAVAGVVFTGSTDVARRINRDLAAKDGAIVPLIAETGGLNAMIVDSTALPEQVADDVVASAFRSAGQRCSALRLLFVQEEVADAMIAMIAGAATLTVGSPADPSVLVGPVIDAEAKDRLLAHIAAMRPTATVHYAGSAPDTGSFVAPHVIELAGPEQLQEEVFGPILHVVRYRAGELDRVLGWIAGSGYGLTLGLQSRIDGLADRVVERLPVGNVYVNRNMIGAVVGVQPFGGFGLSGTGPKAGGPHYLLRFAVEQTVTVNTSAAGGNVALLALEDA